MGCDHDCGSCGQDCSKRDFIIEANKNSNIKKIIGIVSGKGGVGKSLVTGLSAVSVMRDGKNAGILDADITGPSIPKMFGVSDKLYGTEDGLIPAKSGKGIKMVSTNLVLDNPSDPVVWRGPVVAGLVKQFYSDVMWEDVDYLFVDMPPGTGDVPLTVFQSLPLDGIIVVASPQELVSLIVEKALKMANMMNIPVLGLVENMSYISCPDCGKQITVFGESHIDEVADKYALPVIAKLPIDAKLTKACDEGKIEGYEGEVTEIFTASLLEAIK